MANEPAPKPVDADLRAEDDEYNPKIEPRKSKAWLNLLTESEKAFESWNDHCDAIDKRYASLSRLSEMARDKEFQMFWANCEVIKPSIYAKPPVPVVVPKFKDRRPVYQAASEVAERCAIVSFDLSRVNELMLLVRDDLAMISRGVAWCRYESGKDNADGGRLYESERVCIDFKNRRDFLHSVSRNWSEVTWVAAASYLTRSQARKRFYKHSGNAYQEAEYRVDKESKNVGGADDRERAKFWEIWHRGENRVLWVAHGVEDILDEDKPHLDLRGFYPCPKPAYGTVQRGSLVPVPDVLQYKDQLEELNMLTGRIHALSDALEAKGFYPAGGAELGDAVQAAVRAKTPGRLLVPISNWAAFGGSKEVIIWLPIDMIAQTVTALVALRKQVIEDIYQIMGLADIMRGATDPNETLGAQQMKNENGSHRIKDKQGELVRLARDLVDISLDIIFEKFDEVTIIEMSQTQLPTQQMMQRQMMQVMQKVQQAQQQAQQLMQNPQIQQMAAQKPEMAQQAMQQFAQMQQQAQQEIEALKQKPTIEQVLHFLKSNRAKGFVLDIETDSTIQADENAEKQRRTEFVGVLSQLLPQIAQMIGSEPSTAEFCGDLLKFAIAPFRAGRSLDGSIDNLVEQMKAKGSQTKEDPETKKLGMMKEIEMAKLEQKKLTDQGELKIKQDEIQAENQRHTEKLANDRAIATQNAQGNVQDAQIKLQQQNEKLMQNREAHQAHMIEKQQDMQLAGQKQELAKEQMGMKRQDMQAAQADRQADMQFKQQDRQADQQFKHQQAAIKNSQPQGPRQ